VTEPLPDGGPDREILLRALREYSDNCQPPALTAGCPFAYDIEPGVRGCGEECIDILARYNAPPSVDEIPVGPDVTIRKRRPRARWGPSKSVRPFDVSEIYLTDSEIPHISKWRMPALIECLKRELAWQQTQDRVERAASIDRVSKELTRRGIDTESLIRFGFGGHIAVSILLARVVAGLVGDESKDYPGQSGVRPWVDIIDPPSTAQIEQRSLTAQIDIPKILPLIAWVLSAPLPDVLEWTPPGDRAALSRYPLSGDNNKPEFAWLADRFTETYLSSWRSSSLQEEWQYINGRRVAPCGRGDMASRKIGELELARALADEHVEGDDEKTAYVSSAPHYVPLALKLLEDGHRETAAAMFEAATTLAPDNAELFNNWAFCIIPDDPEKALELLDQAAILGMALAHTVVGNKLYCFLRLGRYTTGLTYAEEILAKWGKLVGDTSYMWAISGEVQVTQVNSPSYTLDVIEAIAAATDDSVIKAEWAKRVEAVRNGMKDC
jgi:hypothetical protein